ncbi:MAG: hypothetical protein AABW56_00005 [Nanoarchaeota archaeon]
MVIVDLKKRDLWILTALIFFLIGVGLVIGFGDYKTGNPKVIGHSSDEIMVLDGSGAEITLQAYINNIKPGLEYAQAFRKSGPGPIITVSGSSSAFVTLDNKAAYSGSMVGGTKADGIGCNGALGWKVTGCWVTASGTSSEDLIPYNNGCITKKYDTENVEMSIVCIKIS